MRLPERIIFHNKDIWGIWECDLCYFSRFTSVEGNNSAVHFRIVWRCRKLFYLKNVPLDDSKRKTSVSQTTYFWFVCFKYSFVWWFLLSVMFYHHLKCIGWLVGGFFGLLGILELFECNSHLESVFSVYLSVDKTLIRCRWTHKWYSITNTCITNTNKRNIKGGTNGIESEWTIQRINLGLVYLFLFLHVSRYNSNVFVWC